MVLYVLISARQGVLGHRAVPAPRGSRYGRKRASSLSLGERLQLSCHKQKDSGSRADTSSISTGTRPTAPWITTAAACTQSSGATGGPRPLSHVKLSASTPMGRLILHLRREALGVVI